MQVHKKKSPKHYFACIRNDTSQMNLETVIYSIFFVLTSFHIVAFTQSLHLKGKMQQKFMSMSKMLSDRGAGLKLNLYDVYAILGMCVTVKV